jgi:hypothetical protein
MVHVSCASETKIRILVALKLQLSLYPYRTELGVHYSPCILCEVKPKALV